MRSLSGGFPKFRGTIMGIPIIRIIVFWGLHRGSLVLGNYQVSQSAVCMPLWPHSRFAGSRVELLTWGSHHLACCHGSMVHVGVEALGCRYGSDFGV